MRSSKEASHEYLESLFSPESEAMLYCKALMNPTGKMGMSMSAAESSLLAFFIESQGFKKAVEIGTFAGYSALWIAKALGEGGVLHSFEFSPEHYKMANECIEKANYPCQVKIHLGDAKEELKKIEIEGPFDFVFIDANKGAYPEYLDWAIANTKSSSWIVGDNTLLFNELGKETPEKVSKNQWQAMRDFNKKLSNPELFLSCFIPTAEGMSIGIRR